MNPRGDTIPFGPAWIEMLRTIVQRDRIEVQAGPGDSMEAKSPNSQKWMQIQVPGGKAAFPSTAERDAALIRIQTP